MTTVLPQLKTVPAFWNGGKFHRPWNGYAVVDEGGHVYDYCHSMATAEVVIREMNEYHQYLADQNQDPHLARAAANAGAGEKNPHPKGSLLREQWKRWYEYFVRFPQGELPPNREYD